MPKQHKTFEFIGQFAPITTAIKIGMDGARIQLDIPENYVDTVRALQKASRNSVIQFVGVPLDEDDY
jgi:hypothetical protein